MNEYIKIKREINPKYKLPENLDTAVWHYMDMYKFEFLLNKKSLYFCRADRLEDRFEGSYSKHQINQMNEWFIRLGEGKMIESEQQRRLRDRKTTYIHCWCLGDADFDLMWKAYVKKPPGVALKSSVKRLIKICDDAIDHWPLDISVVTYFDHAGGQRIDYLGRPVSFFYKDNHFKLDNELRLVHWQNYSTPPEHVEIPISLNDLIESVILQPKADIDSLKFIRRLIDDSELNQKPVVFSRDDREFIE